MEYFVIQIKKTFCYSFSIFKVNGLTVYHVIMEYFSQGFTGMANFAFLAVTGVTNFKKVQLVLFSSCFPSKFSTRSNCIFPCSLQNLSRITSYFHNTYLNGVHMVVLHLSIMLMEHCHFPDYSCGVNYHFLGWFLVQTARDLQQCPSPFSCEICIAQAHQTEAGGGGKVRKQN